MPVAKKAKKVLTSFRPMVRSRHKTHNPLRTLLGFLPFRSVVRLGSTWKGDGKERVECNTVDAVKTSSNKRLMKMAFDKLGVKCAQWVRAAAYNPSVDFGGKFPIVAKSHFGSRGKGNTFIKSLAEWNTWKAKHDLDNYIVEKFYDYSREYRLHVTKDGCFYTCRKALKTVTPEADRWYRNDSNCTWFVETNPKFDKPVNWSAIVAESVKALNAVGLDVGAIDVKVQKAVDAKGVKRTNPEFIILETNSAPSHGEAGSIVRTKYQEIIPKILKAKKGL